MLKHLNSALLLLLALSNLSVPAQTLSARRPKPANGTVFIDWRIPQEGTYEVQSAAAINTRFWATITNFTTLPATNTIADPLNPVGGRFYRLARLTNPPAILIHPQGLTNYYGTEVRLTSTASGSAPLRIRWYKDGKPLDAATATNLTFSAHPSLSGAYTLVATNPWGIATSTVANVKVLSAVAPAIAGKTIRFNIENAQGDFEPSGNFTTVFNAQGYYNTAGSSPLLNDTGYWAYGILSDNTARILLPGSISYPDGNLSLLFQDPQNGVYTLAAPGRFGFQTGRFQFLN